MIHMRMMIRFGDFSLIAISYFRTKLLTISYLKKMPFFVTIIRPITDKKANVY